MKFPFIILALLFTSSVVCAQQPGRSGVIKVRKSGQQHFYVDIKEPAVCRQVTEQHPIPDFKLDCSDCPQAGGLVWMYIIISANGDVDEVAVEKPGDPQVDKQAMQFARTLRFDPYLIEGKKRSVRFLFPVRFYLP